MNNTFERLNGKPASREEVKRRYEHVKEITVIHPNFNEVWQELCDVHYLSRDSVKADVLMIFGESGVGKSTLLHLYEKQYPREVVTTSSKTFTKIPVLYVKVPERARSPITLTSEILFNFADPLCGIGNIAVQTQRIRHFIKECQVEMIIIDEFQDLIDRDTDNVLVSAANWLKLFAENVNIPVVLCGLPNSERVFKRNGQLDSRFTNRVDLCAFRYDTDGSRKTFCKYLDLIDEDLPFAEKSGLAKPDIASRIFYMSLGVSRQIKDLLKYTTRYAAEDGHDSLTLDYLNRGFQKMRRSDRPYLANPFSVQKFVLEDALHEEKIKWDGDLERHGKKKTASKK